MGKRSRNSRAQQAGIVLAAAETPLSFQKTLMERSDLDQGLLTGVAAASNYGIGVLVQEQVETLAAMIAGADEDDEREWRRIAVLLDLAVIGGGIALQRMFREHQKEKLEHAAVRTTGFWMTKAGLAGLSVGVLQGLLSGKDDGARHSWKVVAPAALGFAALGEINMRRRRAADDHETEEWDVSGLKAGGIGAVAGLGVLGLSLAEHKVASGTAVGVSKVLPGSSRAWKPLGHLVALGAMAYGVKVALTKIYRKIESLAETIEPAYEEKPEVGLVSGSDESLIAWETLSRAGRRNASTVLTPGWIEAVMGEKAMQPARVFVGLESAGTEEERVQLAMDELERVKGFDRGTLMVVSPTGTGYANYVAIEAAEYMTRGDLATVVMQYSMRPSPLSLDRVVEGRHLQRMLVRAIHERIKDQKKKPQLVLFGESLGAWTSQDPFEHRGTFALQDVGIDRALWIGTPYQSRWKTEVLNDDRPDVDRGLVGVFDNFGALEALPREERDKLRYVMITHDNDAVAHFWFDLLLQAPKWLGKDHDTRPKSVPKNQKWSSPTTFWQTAIDMKNAANVVPGVFEAKGHDYRKDLSVFIREVYDFDVSDEQLEKIETALREFEVKRAELAKEKNAKDKAAPSAKKSTAKKSTAKKSTAKKPKAKKPKAAPEE